jgi:hypothetical protein
MDPVKYVQTRVSDGLSFAEACAEYRLMVREYVETLRNRKAVG